MASLPTSNAFARRLPSASPTPTACSASGSPPPAADRKDPSRGSLVLQAARLLGPPAKFESSKLRVVFLGEGMKNQVCAIPRTYNLTHCDFTANLTLAVFNDIKIDQLRRWQANVQRDDVVAEWKKVKEDVSLHIHCYVSGATLLQDLAAEFRYYIFCKELPLVLNAVVYGDSDLFNEHPGLLEAPVWVHFHSTSRKYNRLESWGPLKEAMQRTLEDMHDEFHVDQRPTKLHSPKAILHAFFSFLL